MPRKHTVRQGECISSIAAQYGFFPDTIWDHPDNADLKREREDGYVLQEGDVLTIPDLRSKETPAATEQRHVFRRKGVPEMLNIVLRDEDGNPRAGIPYRLDIDGRLTQGTTDGNGAVREALPPGARRARLWVENDEDDDQDEDSYEVLLGHLDPITSVSGVQMRLENLGFYDGDIDGEMTDGTRLAIEEFQESEGLDPTGELDETTRSKIEEAHGS